MLLERGVNKPIIGITAKISYDENVGLITNQGCMNQSWVLLANDYVQAVEQAGGVPIVIPVLNEKEDVDEIIDLLDGIIFSGGNDIDPKFYGEELEYDGDGILKELDEIEMALYKKIYNNTKMPILGICRGLQLINVTQGGTLYQEVEKSKFKGHKYCFDPCPKDFILHEVIIEEGSILSNIVMTKSIRVNSFHHQIIKDLGAGLKASGISDDGVIEGIEGNNNRFLMGLQWHPEMLASKSGLNDDNSNKIFGYFIEKCSEYKSNKDK